MGKHGKVRKYCSKKRRNQNLLTRYGISADKYDEILEEQCGECAICGYEPSSEAKGLFVDHSHETYKIRGLLCQWCNSGLGYFKDSRKILKTAIKYLTRKTKHGKIKARGTN